MEITFGDIIRWGTIRARWSDFDGEHYFVLPVTMYNASDQSQSFPWGFDAFGPDRQALDRISWDVDAEDITRVGNILPGGSSAGYLHLLFVGDGEYTLQFSDWSFDDELRINFHVEFDSDAVPVIQTEFSFGETLVFDNLEITFMGSISFIDVSDERIMRIPVTVTNIGDDTNSFPTWQVTSFGPDGLELGRIPWGAPDDISRPSTNIRPGASRTNYFSLLFDGYGEYIIEFSRWDDTLQVIFSVRHSKDVEDQGESV